MIIRSSIVLLIVGTLFFMGSAHALPPSQASLTNQSPSFIGKPINLYNGEETLRRTDVVIGSIAFERIYSSGSTYSGRIGYGWYHSFDRKLQVYPDGSVLIRREGGAKIRFSIQNGQLTAPAGDTGTLSVDTNGNFVYTYKDASQEIYNVADGTLKALVNPNGSKLELTHVPAPNAPPTSKEKILTRVEERSASGSLTGRTLTISYDSNNRINGLTDSLNRSVSYKYDTNGNLTTVTTSSMTSTYGYNDPVGKYRMTDITEGGAVYTNIYDASGRVIKQTHGTGTIDITYVTPLKKTKATTTIRDAAGTVLNIQDRTVEFNAKGQPMKVTDTFGNETRYDRNFLNLIIKEEHWEKGTVKYTITNSYDAKGNLLSTIEGGASAQKITSYTYDPVFSKVLTETVKSVAGGQKVTTYGYDSKGNATSVTETGSLGDGTPYSYVTGFKYDSDGHITEIDGPRTDLQDVTTFGYDSAGNLTSMTQPIIGATTYSGHDSFGNPGAITDPNGNTTNYTYDGQGRVLTVSNGGSTSYTYISQGCGSGCGSNADKIESITFPEGNAINYNYDPYGNLTSISDSRGGSITYTNDSEGNRLTEAVSDPKAGLARSLAYQYDALNRLRKITNPGGAYTEYTYDSLGNRLSLRNPNAAVTGYNYDALSRLLSVTQPGSIKTSYGYDSSDNLISVTDANSNATAYKYDDMGRVYQVNSPDTGTTTYTYDPAGNMRSKTDAMGVTINYTYDALNRLIKIDFPTDTDIVYTYDNCANGKGRLCGITDASGTTAYEYTPKGQVVKETKVIDGVTYVTQYTYSQNGDVASITYPGGRVVNYNYTSGLVSSITTTGGGVTTTIAANIVQGVFGGISNLAYGNGLSRMITYDNQGRIGSIATGSVQSLVYGYDDNSNITGITNNVDPAKNKTYAYDALDRLTGAVGPWGLLGYTYDGVGNRKTETSATGATNYAYSANKLVSSTGVKTLAFGYDGNGNTTSENGRQYIYNQNQRLIKAAEGSSAVGEYVYNASGQRTKKMVNGATTVFHFDNNGRMIAESDNSGNIVTQYVYLNGQPIAKIDSNGINYIHTDHLGTPVMMTNGSGQKVWEIESKPFGDDANIAGSATLNGRFPGQYYDAETGLHYNYFRDYSPKVGRYVEADPIGLSGGMNLFAYVNDAPVGKVDEWGLAPCSCNCQKEKKCRGMARVLEGNARLIGKAGPFSTKYPISRSIIEAGSAAVIPDQFGTNKSGLRPNTGQICGSSGDDRIFTGITDIIGGKVPKNPCKAKNVRDALKCLYPGMLILEVPGGEDLGVIRIDVVLPKNMPCPAGSEEISCSGGK